MERIKQLDIDRAVAELSMCQFFPSDPMAQGAIGALLRRMCRDREPLEWLVRTFVDRVGTWKGPVELRAVLCTRYKPADGVEAFSELPGFTAHESESAYLQQHEHLKTGGWDEPTEHKRKELAEIDRVLKQLAAKKGL